MLNLKSTFEIVCYVTFNLIFVSGNCFSLSNGPSYVFDNCEHILPRQDDN